MVNQMVNVVKNLLNDLKTFNWKVFIALCLLALVPAIYQTVITKLITSNVDISNLDIIGQMEWYDLIDETLRAFLIVPMYSILSKVYKKSYFNKIVFKLGIIVFTLYSIFSLITLFYGIHLISFMNPSEIDINATYKYLSIETVAFMVGIIFSYISVVLLVIGKARYMYIILIVKVLLSLLSDIVLIPSLGINGIAISNVISNSIVAIVGIILLVYEKTISTSRFNKEDLVYIKDWIKTGLFAGGQQFLDNIIYSLMIVRMVNAVNESGNYWVSNNFIWGWLLIPISSLIEVIRKDAGINGYNLRQRNYYFITLIVILLWFALIPTYKWFFNSVEGIENYNRIFEIVLLNLGFYVAYAFSQIPDAIFVGIGKTKYIAINSLICNIGYYGIWFILYMSSTITMNMNMIIIMFGCGNIVHWIVSLMEEKVFLNEEKIFQHKVDL